MKTKEQKYREAVERAFSFNVKISPMSTLSIWKHTLNEIKRILNIRKADDSYDERIHIEIRKAYSK